MASDTALPTCSIVMELSNHMKLESKSGILSCLTCIKNDPNYYKEFIEEGGLSLLIKLFHYKFPKILNMVLSILANACLASNVRQEMRETKIASHVVSILKTDKFGALLHCRACRLVGNLADCSWHAKSLYNVGVVQVLTNVLKSQTSVQTYLMAVRAIRKIWTTVESSREEILEAGTIGSITVIFITAKDKLHKDNSAKYTELTQMCLKAMCVFLESLDPRCGDQIRGENNAQGYRYIVEYCQAKNRTAVTCLYNLCQIAECRPVLGSSGAVECLVILVIQNTALSWEILASLCLFCREAVNRVRIKCCTGLEVMLVLLKKTENEKFHPMLLHALAQFIYDDEGILIMVKNGLLDVLVTKLKQMVLEMPRSLEEKTNAKKRSGDASPDQGTYSKYNRTNKSRFSLDYHRDDWSPGSTMSACSSPPSTPPLPFYENEIDESAEDNYSPVCTDSEWGDNEEPQEEIESPNSSSSTIVETEETRDSGKNLKVNEHANMLALALLSRLSHSNEPIHRLADPTTIEPLTAYIRFSKNSRASRILTRIVRNRAYLVPLLKQGFVFEAQTLYGSEQYTRQLCALAETGGALGELASILLRGQDCHKSIIAVSIPFLIKSRDVLKTLLNNYGGLSLIFHILTDQKHELYERAIWAICRLGDSLNLRPEPIDMNQGMETDGSSIGYNKNVIVPAETSIVTFELDDGSTVDACRYLLCQRSDFFAVMLEGNFVESGKRRVKLQQTSKGGLEILLLATNGDPFDNRPIEMLLDAVVLADKFLMCQVSRVLLESLVDSINFENFSRTWSWARKNKIYNLKTYCIKSFLTTKLTKAERLRAFRDFSTGECFQEFLSETKEIINSVLLCQR